MGSIAKLGDISRCKTCVYFGKACHTCDYWEIEDKLRPCPPGKLCTVYTSGKHPRNSGIRIWDKELGRQLYLQGKTDREIAAVCGCSATAVWYQRNNHWSQQRNKKEK